MIQWSQVKNHKTEENFWPLQNCIMRDICTDTWRRYIKEWKIFNHCVITCKLSLLRDDHMWELFNIFSWEFCQNLHFEASQAVFLALSAYKELKQSHLQVICFAAFQSKCKILASEVWAYAKSKSLINTAVLTFYF